MIERITSFIQSKFQNLQDAYEYKQAWEKTGTHLEYNTVVKQASGYSVTIDKIIEYENRIDGETKKRRKLEFGSTWVQYNSRWQPGMPLEYRDQQVISSEKCRIFGDVARGYRR